MGGGVNTSTFTESVDQPSDVTVTYSYTHTLTNELAHWRGERTKPEERHHKFHFQSAIVGYYSNPMMANNATAPLTVTRTSKLSGVSVPDLHGFSEWDCIENKHGERRERECSDGSLKDSEPGGAERKEEVRRLVEFCDESNLIVYLEIESAFYLMHTCLVSTVIFC